MADARKILSDKKAQLLQQADEIDRDLEELDRISAKYDLVVEAREPASQTAPVTMQTFERGEKTAAIENACAVYVRKKGARASASEMARALVAQGIDLGPVPARLLSAFLAKSKQFDNDREHGGYGLIDQAKPGKDGGDLRRAG